VTSSFLKTTVLYGVSWHGRDYMKKRDLLLGTLPLHELWIYSGDGTMEGNIDRESQLLADAVEWILTPVTAGSCSPVPTEIIKELSLLICHLARAIHDLTTAWKITSLNTAEHRLFCSFFLMRFLMRACGDGDIAPRITLGPR
jgi:hypothetical protein